LKNPEHHTGLYYRRMKGSSNTISSVTIINEPISNEYFENKHTQFFDYPKNYFIYNTPNYNCNKSGKVIQINDIDILFKNSPVFIRSYPPFCEDAGREYMEHQNLVKIKGSENFYT
jgi:hypothetical protein